MKNDITYEYRVFTNRLVDVEPMEVGVCTSKVVKELKLKDKVDGRFFHTTDKDEWFFCWNGELQKLNLKGNADVNAALEKAEQLIAKANTAVKSAKEAAADATTAADAATAAVESIDNKADKSDVEALEKKVDAIVVPSTDNLATKDSVEALTKKVDAIVVPSTDNLATKDSVEALTKRVTEIDELIGQVEEYTNTILND